MLDKDGLKPLIRRVVRRFSRHGVNELRIMHHVDAIVEREAPDPGDVDFPRGRDVEDALFEMVLAGELTWHDGPGGETDGSVPLIYRLARVA